jgi:hypothetical protein
MRRKFAYVITVFLSIILGIFMARPSADAVSVGEPGSSPDNPIVVTALNQVPSGAVQTGSTVTDCATTTTWTLTIPATEDSSHQEFRYKRDIPAVEEQSHLEWGVEQRSRTVTEVPDFITQYHFSKYVHTKTRTYTEATEAVAHWWNWSPNNTHGPQDYTPGFPVDEGPDGRPRGTWQGPHVNGGPMQDTFGTFQTGGGNSPFFHRVLISAATAGGWGPWSEYGPWTQWLPVTHESWENSNTPLGVPQFHGSGQDGNVQWHREWQAQFDGQTRQFQIGTRTETSEWTPWTVLSSGLTVQPTLDENTNVREFRLVGPVKVVDVQAAEGYTEYYVLGGEPSRNVSDASWIRLEQAPQGWTQFDSRTVVDQQGTPAVVTYYSYNDGVKCPPVEPPVPPVPPTPPVPPVPPTPPVPPVDNPPTDNPPKDNPPKDNPPKDTPNPPKEPDVPTLINAGL